jgi:hypothetical protein
MTVIRTDARCPRVCLLAGFEKVFARNMGIGLIGRERGMAQKLCC